MYEKPIHLDLFSGIGGFALAADRVFGDVKHTFCEIDPFCQEVLKKHWPEAKIYGDIRSLTADSYWNGLVGRNTEVNPTESEHSSQRVAKGRASSPFILTGGFPCQPFSQAGRRRGTEDDRYLWPEMLRVIREFSPLWVIAENVRGLLTQGGGVVFERVCTDLEAAGYEVQPLIIPAVAVNAPHRRDRVWIVAHRKDKRCERSRPARDRRAGLTHEPWRENWLEVATRLCRVDDGLPRRMDRNPRLKALGNAIVPQVAEEIMRAIRSAHN